MPVFILIDGHSLAFRSYYAFATSKKGPLRTSTGIPTSVCFGFLNSLLQAIESQKPQGLAVAFDRREPTFRHAADANYKADREETPEDFIPDLENLKALLSRLNLPVVTAPGYEADDVLGTLAQQASQAGYQVKIVTGDRDLFQLVDESKGIGVLYLDRNAVKTYSPLNYQEFDSAAVQEKLGIAPSQVVDYKALCGDKSDNIPGVKGIGEKTAVKLLQEYGTLEEIYQNLEQIKGAVKDRLIQGREAAVRSRYLAQISLEVPLDVNLESCRLQGFDPAAIEPLLNQLELKTFLNKIDRIQAQLGGIPTVPTARKLNDGRSGQGQQLSLFQVEETSFRGDVEEDPPLEGSIAPQIIDTSDKLTDLIELLKTHTDRAHPVAWDTETTALDPRQAKLVGVGCCWGTGVTEVAYLPANHTEGRCLPLAEILSALGPILESDRYPKAFQNTKFDRLVFRHQGIELRGVVFDTLLASYVLRPEQSHSLSDLCQRYLSGITSLSYQALGIPKGKTMADIDIQTAANYCGMDAYSTYHLVPVLKLELAKVPELEKLLLTVEQPLEPLLARMEDTGIRIDTAYLQELSKNLEKDLQAIEEKVYLEAGEEFNLSSPQQLGKILFEKLGLSKRKTRKTKTGYSTDRATLEKLQGDSPIIDSLLEYRTLAKLKSTYVDALPALVDDSTHRIHTDFNQAVTATGRLSSSNPNLQNIPIRSEFSRKIRQAFIPEEGWLLVSVDYSQIELRILAHLSQEPILLQAYSQGQDIHAVTARLLFEKEDITPQERNLGKTINFGVIYGMGAQRFAREVGVSAEEGKAFIEKYRQRYGKVFSYLEQVKKAAISQGFVTTILGRRRYFDFASESLRKLRGCPSDSIDLEGLKLSHSDAQLLRAAANAPIQGSSADIIKVAMVKLNDIVQNSQARLLLQVHDELVFEVPPPEWEALQPKIVVTMETAVPLRVPLVVEVHVGKNWMEAN